jgi:hypothetical protein
MEALVCRSDLRFLMQERSNLSEVQITSITRFRGFRLTQHCFNSCLLFYSINRHMFRSYDHFQAEIYTMVN